MNHWLSTGLIVSAAVLLAAACGEDNTLFGNPGVGGSGGEGGTTSSSSSSGGLTGGGGTTSSGGGMGGGSGGAGGGAGGSEPCLGEGVPVSFPPFDMVLIPDRSGSMAGSGKWTTTQTAIVDFANAPRPPGTSLALNYNPTPASSQQFCEVGYYNPPQFPLTPIPSGAGPLVADVNNTTYGGGSGWSGALEGSLAFATAHKAQHGDHIVVVVMTADNLPYYCDTDFNNLANLASSALGYNGVRTYVVMLEAGQPYDLTGPNQVAQAGGTQGAVDLTGQGDIGQLNSVLNQIRDASIPCEYAIPQNPNGPLLPEEVNLAYTPGGSSTAQVIPQVAGGGSCGNDAGWTYDNPNAPTTIVLCPATCNTIKLDPGHQVDVVFGCPTLGR